MVEGLPDLRLVRARLSSADVALLPVLSPAERARVEAAERPADAGRLLVSAALTRAVLGECLGCDPAEATVSRSCPDCGGEHGPVSAAGPAVSVSHAGPWIVLAASRLPVGIDVESEAAVRAAGVGQTCEEWVRGEARVKFETLAAMRAATGRERVPAAPLALDLGPGWRCALVCATALVRPGEPEWEDGDALLAELRRM